MTKTKHQIGLLIRSRRKELNLNQREFAELIGCKKSRVSEIEQGKANPYFFEFLEKLEKVGIIVEFKVK